MKTEIEVKFINVNIDEVREKLRHAGAVLEHPMHLMRRALIDNDELEAKGAFLRIRDEGDKVTMTFKQAASGDSNYAQEIETTVGNFDETLSILKQFNLNHRTYQESKRETWKFNDVEVVIDEWPWINPYIEIEGETEESVKQAAKDLGYAWDEGMFGSVDVIYAKEFPDMTVRGVIDIKEVHFGDPIPEQFKDRA